MSGEFSKDIQDDLKTVIRQILAGSVFEENKPAFNKILKHWTVKLKKSDTTYYANKQDVDRNIDSMMEKFCFHGFFKESEFLRRIYKDHIITDGLPKTVCMNRLSVINFLLSLSEAPTQKLLETPFVYTLEDEEFSEKIDDIDWAVYLNEGIEKWEPNFAESEESDLDSEPDGNDTVVDPQSSNSSTTILPVVIKSNEKFCTMDLKASRDELTAVVQHSWYHSNTFHMVPESHLRQANIGILWEEHIRDQVKCLILLENSSVISEYNVIREILWQLWGPHNSTTFELCGNTLKPKSNITIRSVRQPAFYSFMEGFIPYIEILYFFREFEKTVGSMLDENMCVTYRCYSNSLTSIINPIYRKLCDIEDIVREQNTTYTLQNLAYDLDKALEPLKILKEIHCDVTLDFTNQSSLKCATYLLAKLHDSLHFSVNKSEQDLKVTLFLESSYHYFSLINSWLTADNLTDYTNEFLIEKRVDSQNVPLFVIKDNIDDFCINNSFLKVIFDKVLKIGKNINFLRLLGKFDMIGEFQGSVYEEFIQTILQKLENFYKIDSKVFENEKSHTRETTTTSENIIFPVISSNGSTLLNPEFEKLENLVDTSDGFLMNAFASFFVRDNVDKETKKISLFQRISDTTKNLFPKTDFFENIFLNILDERFTVSGLMVKKLLIEHHSLEKQFEFLRHLFLFWDDLIFPFYRRIFADTYSSKANNQVWAYELWLSSYLQDIFMDMYPDFSEKCSVSVKEEYVLYNTDPMQIFKSLKINYEIPPLLNAIIHKEQIEKYQEMFQFLLILKWAIYTVNHLIFTDLEPKTKLNLHKSSKSDMHTKQLKQMKFCLINILNSLQHFIFGSILSKNFRKFDLDLEKSTDLSDLINSHAEFVNSTYATLNDIRNCVITKDKTNNVLNCIKVLKLMWNNKDYVTSETLKECKMMYDDFYKAISPIVFPVSIYDY